MKNERILDSAEVKGARIDIVEMTELNGAQSTGAAQSLFFAKQSNVKMKFIRITLSGGSVRTESGALYYSKGRIQSQVPTGGPVGMIGKMVKSKLTKETAFNPVYSGVGEVVLEPTFEHYILLELNNETIIVDKGLYYCSIGDINTSIAAQGNVSSAMFGGEGIFQTKITGTGFVALQIPVPMEEVEIYNLQNETVQVDGNFALLRSGTIDFSVRLAGGGVISSATSGEGLLQTFTGTGHVWVAPTAPVYAKMRMGGISGVNIMQGNSNNRQ